MKISDFQTTPARVYESSKHYGPETIIANRFKNQALTMHLKMDAKWVCRFADEGNLSSYFYLKYLTKNQKGDNKQFMRKMAKRLKIYNNPHERVELSLRINGNT